MTEYYFYYILSLFNKNKRVKLSQIVHIIQGKRTPSMFYLAEINHWHHIFGTNKNIKIETLNEMVALFEKQAFIESLDEGYILTQAGIEAIEKYFDNHYYPHKITHFNNMSVRTPFWERIQLFSQVFSELSYNNALYVPVVKHPHHQESVRLLFQAFPDKRDRLLEEWISEQRYILQQLNSRAADTLVNQMSSHHFVGKTKSQLAKELEMEKFEFQCYFNDVIEEYIENINKNNSNVPITFSILKQMYEETHLGLSVSTYHTYQLLKKGQSLSEIATIRQLKVNTIREHILEMAFVLSDFPYKEFIPTDIYRFLHKMFETNPKLSYRELQNDNEAIEFMHYRLVELERIRKS